ncbi:MAG: aspartate aminotransferase family protein [Deltaproteobacteria bacterium]|nr:aspartate aminotransferase family protein [Candidatus Zymogenaceae bacterium]
MPNTLQKKMFHEMEQKDIFRQAQSYAFDYADAVRGRTVFPTPDALAGLNEFVEPLPESPGDAALIIEILNRYGTPASVAQTGGRYFGFVNGGVIPASLAARWLSDFWDQNTALSVMSPVASKLEEVCESWLRELFSLPTESVAGFVSGTSSAIFCGLAAARYRIFLNNGWDINTKGFYGAPRLRVVAGRQAHGSVIKGIALLGFGTDNIEWVETDAQGRMIPFEIPELDESTILILQAGNVSSGAFDPFDEICEKASSVKAWVHIDGAFGLWAAASDRLSHLTKGMEKADSFSVDGHKTLNTPYDSGIVLCSDRDALTHSLHASGSYIAYSENRDGMLYTQEMSRRARVVELWAALKYLGREGVDELVFGLHSRALQMAKELKAEDFQILNDVVFNQVLVSCDNDAVTEQTMRYIQESGECWVGGAVWDGKKVIRISVCSWATTEDDITRSVGAFVAARKKAVQ